jgi:hypothetical protein
MKICHEPGVTNLADVLLAKGLSGPHHKKIMSQILHYPDGHLANVPQRWNKFHLGGLGFWSV